MQYVQALGMPEGFDWLVILIVALLVFGKKLPDVARGLGKSVSQFKKGLSEVDDIKDDIKDDVANELNKVKDDVAKQTHETTAPKNTQNNN
jgi:sec-independent protein translocase protein TatA